jgi:hypothetical protein
MEAGATRNIDIRIGDSPQIGAPCVTLASRGVLAALQPVPAPAPDVWGPILYEELRLIRAILDRPPWYKRLWAYIKGVFHVA